MRGLYYTCVILGADTVQNILLVQDFLLWRWNDWIDVYWNWKVLYFPGLRLLNQFSSFIKFLHIQKFWNPFFLLNSIFIYASLVLATHVPCFNIKIIISAMSISIMKKIRQSWDHFIYNGNLYVGKMTSLYWNSPLEDLNVIKRSDRYFYRKKIIRKMNKQSLSLPWPPTTTPTPPPPPPQSPPPPPHTHTHTTLDCLASISGRWLLCAYTTIAIPCLTRWSWQ